MEKIDQKIFKAYDIRGIYPEQLNEKIIKKIGQALAIFLDTSSIIIGGDMRVSSPSLKSSLMEGIVATGTEVIDIGTITTEMLYFACASMNLPGAIVTASHNPKEYNGLKMVKKIPDLISVGNGMEEIYNLVIADKFNPLKKKNGAVQTRDIKKDYTAKILSLIDVGKIKNTKIVIDPANGLGGTAIDLIYKNLPVEIIRMYFEPDGRFPNHGGDPLLAENRQDLEKKVVEEKADLGFAFDPDADRFFVVDKDGKFIPGDFMTALFGRYLVEKHGGGKIVYDLRASWAVRDLVEEAGGIALENRVGHSFIKPRMQEDKAIFGGEVTGHYYFQNFYYCDSGMIPSLLLLEMLGYYKKTITELVKPLEEKYFISGEINLKVFDADSVLVNLKSKYKDYNVYELDGISIVAENWHANIRKSNTEPLLRLNIEGKSRDLMEQKRDELLEVIKGKTKS